MARSYTVGLDGAENCALGQNGVSRSGLSVGKEVGGIVKDRMSERNGCHELMPWTLSRCVNASALLSAVVSAR